MASQCVFRPVGSPRPRSRVIAFVCSQEVLFGWHLFGNEETAGPLRRGDKCIYVVNLPGCPHPPFKLTPFIRGIAVKLRGSCSSPDYFCGREKTTTRAARASLHRRHGGSNNRTLAGISVNNELLDKYWYGSSYSWLDCEQHVFFEIPLCSDSN